MSGYRFNFERQSVDFPFYNDNPKLSKWEWILLLSNVLIFFFSLILLNDSDVLFLIWISLPIVTILVITRFKLSLIFKKLTKKDILLIFKLTLLSLILGFFLLMVLSKFINFPEDPDFLLELSIPLQTVIFTILVFYEELFKFSVFILVLALVYKLSNNRKIGVVCAAFITMLSFGVLHQCNYVPISISLRLILGIILQGFGSIFDIYAYVKTKNILISYFTHALFNISLSFIDSVSCSLGIDF